MAYFFFKFLLLWSKLKDLNPAQSGRPLTVFPLQYLKANVKRKISTLLWGRRLKKHSAVSDCIRIPEEQVLHLQPNPQFWFMLIQSPVERPTRATCHSGDMCQSHKKIRDKKLLSLKHYNTKTAPVKYNHSLFLIIITCFKRTGDAGEGGVGYQPLFSSKSWRNCL